MNRFLLLDHRISFATCIHTYSQHCNVLLNKKSTYVIIFGLFTYILVLFTLDYKAVSHCTCVKPFTRKCHTWIKQSIDYMIPTITTKYFPYRTSLFPEKIFISIFMSQYRQLYYASGFWCRYKNVFSIFLLSP